MFTEIRKRVKKIGLPPGSAIYTGEHTSKVPSISVIIYGREETRESQCHDVASCMQLLEKTHENIWINVEGLQDVKIVENLAKHFDLHPLTVEDILNTAQRPKVEEFSGYLFITLKVLNWNKKLSSFTTRQLSIVLGKKFVLTFQETDTNRFDTIRARLRTGQHKKLRDLGSDYLVYRLIDEVVDEYFVVLEALGDKIEQVEELIISQPTQQNASSIYKIKRMLLILRKAIWPMREAIGHLMHVEGNLISKFTSVYLRDVYDHTIQSIDTLETFRDMLSSMLDMYLSSLTNRMNEIMKTLTIISTIFIPITSIASIYGMNFYNMPGIHWRWGYVLTLFSMIVIVFIMLIYFWRRKWILK